MKTKVLIESGNLGSDGSKVDISGLKLNGTFPLTRDFNKNDVIGEATPFIENGKVYTEIDVTPDIIGLYPAIGFISRSEDVEIKDNVRFIKSAQLYEVSLCSKPNSDHTIKPIS